MKQIRKAFGDNIPASLLHDLTVVVTELVGNSVDHGPGETIQVRLKSADDGTIRGEIEDQGTGEVAIGEMEIRTAASGCGSSIGSPTAGRSMRARPTSGSRWAPALRAKPTSRSTRFELEAEAAHAGLVPAEVVGDLVADGALDLGAQELGVVAEVALERVLVDDDPVGEVVAGDRAPM